MPWDFLDTSTLLDDDDFIIDWENLETIIIPESIPQTSFQNEESTDSSTLLQHALFSRLTAAITACQNVGHTAAKVRFIGC